MEITDRARQAIDRGEQWKRAAMENLTPEAHAVELASMAAVDPTRGLVTIGHGEAEALLATAPEGDKIADALRLGLRRATGVDVVYWQACDVLHVAGATHTNPATDDD